MLGFFVFATISFAVLMCMDVMECFLHTLRLHWVEFQSKFYKADGILFQPLDFKAYLSSNNHWTEWMTQIQIFCRFYVCVCVWGIKLKEDFMIPIRILLLCLYLLLPSLLIKWFYQERYANHKFWKSIQGRNINCIPRAGNILKQLNQTT